MWLLSSAYNGILFGKVFAEEVVNAGHGSQPGQHHVKFREEHLGILNAPTSGNGHKPSRVGIATGQGDSRAGIADLGQMTEIPVLQVIHADELLDRLEAFRLAASLGDIEQTPGHRMLSRLPPFPNRVDDHADPFLLVLLLLLQLSHGLAVDVVFDVDVLGTPFVRLRRFLVHILGKEPADLGRLVQQETSTEKKCNAIYFKYSVMVYDSLLLVFLFNK